jgi:mannose-6-phosphate isomerase-like protein (cupin superfamily)
MRTVLKTIIWAAGAVTVYLAGGLLIHNYVLPQQKPDLSNYFRPGDKLASRFEGFDQTVLAVGEDWMHTRLEVAPHAAGPPEHFHTAFSENFTVKAGTLSILVGGEKKTLRAGESISIPPMTDHKPFNETGEIVIVESEDPKTLPIEFGYFLSQAYGVMDAEPDGLSTPQMLMHLSVYGDTADSWISNGPSLETQRAMRTLMAPTARLLGYRNYYEEYRPRRN